MDQIAEIVTATPTSNYNYWAVEAKVIAYLLTRLHVLYQWVDLIDEGCLDRLRL